MKPLAYRLREIKDAEVAESWLKKSNEELERKLEEEMRNAPSYRFRPLFPVFVGFSVIALFIAGIVGIVGLSFDDVLFGGSALILLVLLLSGIFSRFDDRVERRQNSEIESYRKSVRERLERERGHDPFYRRASLIKKVVGEYGSCYRSYQTCYVLFASGLVDGDESVESRYRAMDTCRVVLERAHALIEHAVKNFARATGCAAGIYAFEKRHSATLSERQRAALHSRIVTSLYSSLDSWDELSISDPRGFEVTLHELGRELHVRAIELARFEGGSARVQTKHPEPAEASGADDLDGGWETPSAESTA